MAATETEASGGGGKKAGGNKKLVADGYTQQSTLSGEGNGGSNCDGVLAAMSKATLMPMVVAEKTSTKNGNVHGDGNSNGDVNVVAAANRVVTAAERTTIN